MNKCEFVTGFNVICMENYKIVKLIFTNKPK